jgi:hypothetical protein
MISASVSGRWVPAQARELAARLSAFFDRDVEIVKRLNDAHRRLRCANERLRAGVSGDAIGLIDDGGIDWAIHDGLCAYQSASEERRQLAFEVGELSQQLTGVLCAAGWSAEEARAVNVHELAGAAI